MRCPIDNETLAISERKGIEIDYCQQCRGVWLDRGELDKLIEASSIVVTDSKQTKNYQEPRYDSRPSDSYHQQNNYPSKQKKKRDSFLGDLFDF
jgi:Zn-finger nucleic acid-binding protein